MADRGPTWANEFYLPDLMDLENRALTRGALIDCMALWTIPYYNQRKYWLKLFTDLNYGTFSPLLSHWTLRGLPDPTLQTKSVEIYEYLDQSDGIRPVDDVLAKSSFKKIPQRRLQQRATPRTLQKRRKAPAKNTHPLFWNEVTSLPRKTTMSTLKSLLGFHISDTTLRRKAPLDLRDLHAQWVNEELTECSQSKLSQEQLGELQRSTHFDKKELQQWYKGM